MPAPRAGPDDHLCPPHCTLAQSSERAVARTFAMGGIDRRRSGRRSMASVQGPPHRTSIPAPRASADDRHCPPHCTLAQSSERAVAPTFAMGGIDRRRLGRRSMRACRGRRIGPQYQPHAPARTIAIARRTALSLRAASVQWHPLSRWVASIAAALGGDRCGRADATASDLNTSPTRQRGRSPLPAALHSRSEQRACSGTHFRDGWHRSPPLWAEIDGERAGAAEAPPSSPKHLPRCALTGRAAPV